MSNTNESIFDAQEFAENRQLLLEDSSQRNLSLSQGASARTIERRVTTPEDSAPLSFGQQQMWFLYQVMPDAPVYNETIVFRLPGPLNETVLEQSFNEVIRRHEAWRTTFPTIDGQPVQLIHPVLTLTLPVEDLGHLAENEREAEMLRLVTEDARAPFDLAHGPLLRARLIRLHGQEHRLCLTMHHIITDSVSLQHLFLPELRAHYEALLAGQPSLLPALPIQYADFAVWQREAAQTEEFANQIRYWKQQLHAAPAFLELPTDRPRPSTQTYRGTKQAFELPEALTDALNALSGREGVTLSMTLVAAFQTLLHRYTGQDDLLLGAVTNERRQTEAQNLLGIFVNTLILRADLSGTPSFRELLKRVREVVLGAQEHQDVPFEMLIREVQPERNLAQGPLIQAMLAFEPQQTALESGWQVVAFKPETGTSKFDLSLLLEERPEGLRGWFEYNTDLFDASTIERMIGHWQMLLQSIVSDPAQPISELPLLTPRERQQILVEWNATEMEYPRGRCIHEFFEEQAERRPEALALVLDQQRLTYGELNRQANQLAHYLRRLGVGPDMPVGICVERSLEMIVAMLGILKAGGGYMPIDADAPAERIAFMLEDSQAPVLLTQERVLARLPASATRRVALDADWPAIEQEPATNPEHLAKGEHLAYILYTSGSTGQPKGVLIEHHAIAAHCWGMIAAYGLNAEDHVLQFSTYTFDISVEQIFPTLLVGARLIVRGPEIWTPAELQRQIKEQRLSVVNLPPAYWQQAIAEWAQAPDALADHQVRILVVGGDQLPSESVQAWRQTPLRSAHLLNAYGPTETTVTATLFEIPPSAEQARPGKTISIGRPLPNRTIYLLDKAGQPVPVGVIGELHLGGDLLARGYLNRPELTAERFIADPFGQSPHARLYKTGDLARYLPDGTIECLGRIDYQVKIRGFRVELGEIETALNEQPEVSQAVVTTREDVSGEKRLVAYIVARPEQETAVLATHLRDLLKKRLPYYMIPAAFVFLEGLPLTSSGKVDRRALPMPEFAGIEQPDTFVAPRSSLEEIITGIWIEVLGVEKVGIRDDFFTLGGHSLLATQVVARLRKHLHVDIPVRSLFEASTIAELAEVVTRLQTEQSELRHLPLRAVERDAYAWPEAVAGSTPEQTPHAFPVSLTQEGLWFLHQLDPQSSAYHISVGFWVREPLDVAALTSSLNLLVRRHEALRTVFRTRNGEPVQIVVPALTLDLPVIDLQGMPESEREATAQRLAQEKAQHPFDLACGPLLRVTLFQVAPAEAFLLMTVHHIVFDGWSVRVFFQELFSTYEAMLSARTVQLPALPLQYADFTVWQRETLQGEELAAQLAYWRQQLEGRPDSLELPFDRPWTAQFSAQSAHHTLKLPHALTEALKQLSRQQGVTLYMTLVAAFQVLLYRYTRQEDLILGTVAAGRTQAETEGVIGFFVNTLVLRGDLAGNPSFSELLRRVRETILEAQAHQNVPFAELVKAVQPERQVGRNPLFQVMLSMEPGIAALPDGWQLAQEVNSAVATQFELVLALKDRADGLVCDFAYHAELFDDATIARLAGHLQTLLQGIVADPAQPISKLPLLTPWERQHILVEWNATEMEYPRGRCIHEFFEEQAERRPEAIALVMDQQRLTYGELNRRANQLAHYLRRLGVGPDMPVGICVERSLEMIVAMLGILKAGGGYLPIDADTPAERIAFLLEDSQAPVLLTQERVLARLPESAARRVALDADWPAIEQEPATNPELLVKGEHLAYVIYTSGSTGKPKGVLIEHHAIAAHCWGMIAAYGLSAEDSVLQFSTYTFDTSVEQIFPTLLVGARLIVRGAELWTPAELQRQIKDQRLSVVNLPPAYWQQAIAEWAQTPEVLADHQVRILMVGGDQLPPESVQAWRQTPLRSARLLNVYGPTETIVTATLFEIPPSAEQARAGTSIAIGRPLPNRTIYLLDKAGQPVPVGVIGELHLGGDLLARGYLNRPELTAEQFIADPFSRSPHGRLYKTGDLARYLPDGTIECLGRIDYQVKIRGFRVELGEIETVLNEQSEVSQAVVTAREDLPGEKRLVAYIVARREQETAALATHLRDLLKKRLPYYMIPAAFVFLESLPMTSSGKVDRRALPEPDFADIGRQDQFVAPRTSLEEIIAGIWSVTLGVERVGIHENFFALGGHSLLVMQVITQLQVRLQINLLVRSFFEAPTVAELAEIVIRLQQAAAPATTRPALRAVPRAAYRVPVASSQEGKKDTSRL